MKAFPLYPEPLEILMQDVKANLYSIILGLLEQDNYLRTTAIPPTFSANHKVNNRERLPIITQFF